jgi:hypothetical protein
MDLKALSKPPRLGNRKDLIERGERMRIEVIYHQHDLFRIRIGLVCKFGNEPVEIVLILLWMRYLLIPCLISLLKTM